MENLRILIVEDDPSAVIELKNHLSDMGYLKYDAVEGSLALDRIFSLQPDLVLTEVLLNGPMNGLELAKQAKHLRIPFLFITSLNDRTAYESSKEANTYGYLVKPFDRLTLQSLIENVEKSFFQENVFLDGVADPSLSPLLDRIFIKSNNLFIKVMVEEILYIQGEGNYCTVNLRAKKYIVRMSLKKMFEDLDKAKFMAVHRSFIIQLDKVDALELSTNKVIIGKEALPVGPNFKTSLLEKFKLMK